MADTRQQLSTLLGQEVKRLRVTDEAPPRISVIDVVMVITEQTGANAAHYYERMKVSHPEVCLNCTNYRFPGRGQRNTVVSDVRGIVEIVLVLPGRHAARVRRQVAEILVRFLGGDPALVSDICRVRGLQDELAVARPDDPRRIFGAAVEVVAHPSGDQISRMCTDIVALTLPVVVDKLTAHIDKRLAQLESRQRVNLNVRAPKRSALQSPPIARSISSTAHLFPLARFLDEKEREDPGWRAARKSFSPTFGMQVQVLKKKKLKDDGAQPVYVEQNHRAQLLYTAEDRPLMQHAWELTAAHREDLVARQDNPQAAPALQDRPSVMDLLQSTERKLK
jgi:hypothetical protein